MHTPTPSKADTPEIRYAGNPVTAPAARLGAYFFLDPEKFLLAEALLRHVPAPEAAEFIIDPRTLWEEYSAARNNPHHPLYDERTDPLHPQHDPEKAWKPETVQSKINSLFGSRDSGVQEGLEHPELLKTHILGEYFINRRLWNPEQWGGEDPLHGELTRFVAERTGSSPFDAWVTSSVISDYCSRFRLQSLEELMKRYIDDRGLLRDNVMRFPARKYENMPETPQFDEQGFAAGIAG